MMKEIAKKISKLISSSQNIAIVSHINPDGDNLGSCSALLDILKLQNKSVYFLENDMVPKDFKFIKYTEDRIDIGELSESIDLLVVLDSSDEKRLGKKSDEIIKLAKKVINIDHHKSNTKYADVNLVIPTASSTGEVIYKLAILLGWEISKDAATSLYTAISTDTGRFQYDTVTAETHNIISHLIKLGANTQLVNTKVYQSRTFEKTSLLIKVLQSIKYYENKKIAVVVCKISDFEETNSSPSDTEGIVEFVRNTEGVELAILLKETEDNIKLSLRSKSYIDCTEIAKQFNGGGHVRASGASLYMPLDKSISEVINKASEVFH